MSRIGKVPVELPQGVQAAVQGRNLSCKGPLGSLSITLSEGIDAKVEGNKVLVSRAADTKPLRAMHGTTRALVRNMVEGVTKGFKKQLEVVGVGYRAQLQGKKVALNVGFANTIEVPVPDGVKIEIPDQNHITVSGLDKRLVGQVAADLRGVRKPEPYKGKGVRYANEQVRRKAGKAAATGAAAKK
jgi:large subunit ribosomal protein L6